MDNSKTITRWQSALQWLLIHCTAQFSSAVSMSALILTLISVLATAMGAWRLGVDPGWTSAFFIAEGLLSRYQSWFALALGTQASAFILNRWVANRPLLTARGHLTI